MLAQYPVAKQCFAQLPSTEDIKADHDKIREASDDVIAFVDRAYAHLDRRPILSDIMRAFTQREPALDMTIQMIEKYAELLSEEGAPRHFAIRESEIRRMFGQRWISADSEIPSALLDGEGPLW
jgi:uncharacterized protein YqgV (UPF0045/DUF77 family)